MVENIVYRDAAERRERLLDLQEQPYTSLSYTEQQERSFLENSYSYGSVALEGSDKQIPWAAKVRETLMQNVTLFLNSASAQAKEARLTDDQMCVVLDNGDTVLTNLMHQGAARWWIDNRERPTDELVVLAFSLEGSKGMREGCASEPDYKAFGTETR